VLRIIEADGIPMNGEKYVRTVRTNPGQRYSVLVTAKGNPSPSYWIRATLHPYFAGTGIYANATQPTASAILQYITDNNTNVPIIVPSMDTFNNDDDVIDQSFLEGEEFADEIGLVPIYNATTRVFPTGPVVSMVYNMTITPSHPQITFNSSDNVTVIAPGPQIMFAFNNHTFTHPVTQTILAAVITSNADAYSPTTIQLNKGDIIDLVINNQNPVTHPMHLHGHHSWIIGVGLTNDGYSNGTVLANSIYNTTNPMFRDTISVNALSYLIFRFQADNPGVWIMHCHNDWHLNLGMALVFVESPADVTNYYLNNPSTSIPTTCPASGSSEG
jgi:iron transport multicopper oxidase